MSYERDIGVNGIYDCSLTIPWKKDRSPDVDLHFSLFRVDHLTACTDTRNHSDVNGVDIHAYTRIAQNA